MAYVIRNKTYSQYFSGYNESEHCEWCELKARYVKIYTSLEVAQKELTYILNGLHYKESELEIEDVLLVILIR